jgi:hypothetical protein
VFSNIITVQESDDKIRDDLRVHRKGPRSLYAAFRSCIPELARIPYEPNPMNRSAITCIEFNKNMQSSGLQSIRRRDRTIHGVKWTLKVVEFHLILKTTF